MLAMNPSRLPISFAVWVIAVLLVLRPVRDLARFGTILLLDELCVHVEYHCGLTLTSLHWACCQIGAPASQWREASPWRKPTYWPLSRTQGSRSARQASALPAPLMMPFPDVCWRMPLQTDRKATWTTRWSVQRVNVRAAGSEIWGQR